MKKRVLLFIVLAIAVCMLFTGCLGNILMGFLSEDESAEQGTAPIEENTTVDSDDEEEPEPEPEPEPPKETLAALNTEILSLIGKTNATVRSLAGEQCYSYVMMGGSPVAGYSQFNAAYPYEFWFSAEQQAMLDIWFSESDGQGNAPTHNIWPDSYPVWMIEAWGVGVQKLFSVDEPVTYALLQKSFGAAPELEFFEAYGDMEPSYNFDNYRATYTIDGYTVMTVFEAQGSDYVLQYVMITK